MIRTLKKNQIIIFAIALMLITTGYISYTMKGEQVAETAASSESGQMQIAAIGDARLVSNNNVTEQNDAAQTIESSSSQDASKKQDSSAAKQDSATKPEENAKQEVAAKADNTPEKYFNQSRLDREKMYSEMLESYQQILANAEISAEQKNTAQAEIQKVNSQRNSIMIAENLIKNKGFKDVVIFVNNSSVSVVVMAEKIETAEAAQIQSIVQRELGVGVENIHISNKI